MPRRMKATRTIKRVILLGDSQKGPTVYKCMVFRSKLILIMESYDVYDFLGVTLMGCSVVLRLYSCFITIIVAFTDRFLLYCWS